MLPTSYEQIINIGVGNEVNCIRMKSGDGLSPTLRA